MPSTRLEQVSPIGREFSYELLAAVAKKPEADLQDALAQLTSAGWSSSAANQQMPSTVKHEIVRERLSNAGRSERVIVDRSTYRSRFLKIAEAQPELLAHHYTQAGAVEKAIPYRLKAGELG